jgi:hypothetical protein
MSNKYYKEERARQARFKKSEEEMNKKYKEMTDEESEFEYLNSLFREDSTREYNPVEHYKDGGLVSRGQGRTIKIKKLRCING